MRAMYIQGSTRKIWNRFLVTWKKKKLTRLQKVDTETEVLISVN